MAQKTKTYKSHKEFERDSRNMERQGWYVQNVVGSSQQGGVNFTKTATKALFTGGVGLVLSGRSHKKDKVTITVVYSR